MDLTDYIDSFVEENYGEVSISDTAYHFFELGKKYAKHQMMAKAIDGKVIANVMGNPILHLWDEGRHFIGKKVKVIVIEEG